MLNKLKILLVTLLMSTGLTIAQTGQGTIKGSVIDKKTKEELPFVKVIVYQNGVNKGYAATGFDGKFIVPSLTPGKYDVEVKFIGYNTIKEKGVVVNSDKYVIINYELSPSSEMLDVVEVISYSVPLIDKDGGASGATMTRDDISKMSARSATGVAATVGGVYSKEGDGENLSVRGARSDATYYYIDGIKVRGSSSLPKSAIQEVSVITGGVPANYGDLTGGIISITTRGPSSKYFGSFEGVSSGFYMKGNDPLGYDGKVLGLDKYAYNLLEGMVSGPLLMKKDSLGKKDKPLLGFFISANFTDVLDNRPLANGGAYRIKKDTRDALLNDSTGIGPLRPTGNGSGSFYNSSFLTKDDFEQVKWRMNARRKTLSAAGKIDVNAGPNINLTFGGSFNYNTGSSYSYSNSLMNFSNFGESTNYDWRVYGKFTQRFQNNEEGSTSKIKSAYYTLMVDYSQSHRNRQDARHEDRVFNYGYVGKFKTTRIATYEGNLGPVSGDSLIHNGFKDVLVEFTPSSDNQPLAAQTSQYFNIYDGQVEDNYENLLQIQQGGGLRNGDSPTSIYGIWSNMGPASNSYFVSQNDQLRVTGSGTINLSDHAVSIGFEYEQRWDRRYQNGGSDGSSGSQNGPTSIWSVSRQYMNSHIRELDKSKVTYDFDGTWPRATYSRLNAAEGTYGGQENDDAQYFFDYSVRKKIGEERGYTDAALDAFIDGTEFIDIDNLDPNFFELSMFSPDELLNSGASYASWRGYDHTGKKVSGNTDIQKYFNEYDNNGNFKRNVGAFQPVYISGYVMDKFAFDDIIFNVGLRLDVFDANQPVLKDKYLVYEAKTASDVSKFDNGNLIAHPENIGDDYVVYVNDKDNITEITGYRNGDVWYGSDGVEVNDPSVVEGSKGIAPWLKDASITTVNESAFEDYTAQINLMPRIAFSFPISDEASFFAHYDILTKRPTSGNVFDPADYQFMESRNIILNNPNLKPEKTIDYEIGFQQVLSKTSSVKISVFYKEQRDNVQLINVFQAYPNTYRTYGNRDFGTVKGGTVSYDMRRTGNIRMTASYTLQFANGTGSDATTALSLINAGQPNLRNIFPYTYDQRHAFSFVVDYRYGGGTDYNGLKIGKFGVFENTGLNITSNIGSGTPYSRQQDISAAALLSPQSSGLEGTLNGSRQDWSFRVDAQLDRSFDLEFGKAEDKKKVAYLNVYLRVSNLFNIINTLNVYRATGNPGDDGFLLSTLGQTAMENTINPQSYSDYYGLKVNNPYNFGIPRTIRLGIKFDF